LLENNCPFDRTVTSSTAECADRFVNSIGAIKHIQGTSYFPASVVVLVRLVRLISVVAKMAEFHYMEEYFSWSFIYRIL
jgi:hypothetical protein